jgi:hypothetical protein
MFSVRYELNLYIVFRRSSRLTDVRDGSINGAFLLQFIWQFQEHIAEANQDVGPKNEDMRINPQVYPLRLIL